MVCVFTVLDTNCKIHQTSLKKSRSLEIDTGLPPQDIEKPDTHSITYSPGTLAKWPCWGWYGRGSPHPAVGVWGYHPGIFFWNFRYKFLLSVTLWVRKLTPARGNTKKIGTTSIHPGQGYNRTQDTWTRKLDIQSKMGPVATLKRDISIGWYVLKTLFQTLICRSCQLYEIP